MSGTNSRIPRGTPLPGTHFEVGGTLLCEDEPVAALSTVRRPAIRDQAGPLTAERMPRRFSSSLITSMEDALRSGELTLPELRFALQSATLRSEDDIRLVCLQTIRLKQAIIALGQDAQTLMQRVHPHTVAMLLRSWTIDQN